MQPNIVFLDEYSLGDAELGSIRALGNYTGYRTTAREEVADRCHEADVVITNKVVFRRETLRQLPRLRLICVAATGMNHIDLEAAAELGIAVKNAVGYSTHAVTETTIGAAIGLLRQTVYYDRYVKTAYAGSPLQYHFGRTTHQLYGSKWGIVGLGNIGRSVARYAAEHPGRIRTLTLDEASVSAARNAGIDNARGRFITFMDADDWAEKEFLAEFFRDPAPGPGTIVMQGILLDFSEAEPPGPNEAFFSYDDGALAIGDDPSAAVGQRFLQDGCSVCKLYHTETLRRLGIRFIEHLCSREDHLFFFTCISRMQSVVWRSGVYMHYMRRGRNTLSTRPMPACELVEAAERLDRFIPQLAERFGITDKTYLFALRQNLVRDTLLRAANNIRFGDRRSVLGAIAARPELFGAETYTPRWHPLLKRPLLDRILKGRECHTLLYLRIALRRSSLRLRGRFNA